MKLQTMVPQNEYSTNSGPLVSVIVMTYNSAKYILDTLESAKRQTYRNIELIVTDDCSVDDTVELVESWIRKNHNSFLKTEIITTTVNTGIPANCNRGLKKSAGEWVKIIAGDDILCDTCVTSFVEVAEKNQELKFIASDMHYINVAGESTDHKENGYNAIRGYFFSLTSVKQAKLYARCPLFLNSPSFFMNKTALQSVNYFDEEFRMYDDLPLIFKLIEKGIRINYIDKKTVLYRIYEESFSRSNNEVTSALRIREQSGCFKKYRRKYLSIFNPIDLIVMYDFWLKHSYKGVFGFKALPLMYRVNFYQNYLNFIVSQYRKSRTVPV